MEMENNKLVSQKPIFFENNKTLKTNKMDLLALKTLLKTCKNTSKK